MTLVVALPWPDPRVFPNYRMSHHWRASHKQVKAAREEGWAAILVALEGRSASEVIDRSRRIPVRLRFVPPDKRKRDEDGCLGAVKPYLDGIADALRAARDHDDGVGARHRGERILADGGGRRGRGGRRDVRCRTWSCCLLSPAELAVGLGWR